MVKTSVTIITIIVTCTILFQYSINEAEGQISEDHKCYEKYEIWELIGTQKFTKMFVNDPDVLECISLFESGLKPPQKVRGMYVNSEAGLQIDIPNDWDRLEFNLSEHTILIVRPEGPVYSAIEFDDTMMVVVITDMSTNSDIIQVISENVLGNIFYEKSEPNTCQKISERIAIIDQKSTQEIEFSCYNPTRELVAELKINTFRANGKIISFISAWFHDPSIESRIYNNWWERHSTIETKTSEIKKVLSTLTIEKTTLQKQTTKSQIPSWIKSNARWWSEGQIDDNSFIQGIQFMIKANIINIPNLPEQASETAEEKVPDWIRNNAGWWADGLITEDDFVKGIQYLVEQGIIKV